jgi:hypothetical protein
MNFAQTHNKVTKTPVIRTLVIDGPRGSGKTTLINTLVHGWPGKFMHIKFRDIIDTPDVRHISSGIARMDFMISFLEQVPPGSDWTVPIFDRFLPTEWVMRSFDGEIMRSDYEYLRILDERLARVAGVVLLNASERTKRERSEGRKAEGNTERLWHQFGNQTACTTLRLDTTATAPMTLAFKVLDWFNVIEGVSVPPTGTSE